MEQDPSDSENSDDGLDILTELERLPDNLPEDLIIVAGTEDGNEHCSEEKDEEARFRDQTWEQQWREVMRILAAGQARWDESEKGEGRLLEEYKKKALTNREIRERTTPTFLHILARRRDTDDFESLPEETLLKIIKYLLQHQQKVPVDGESGEPNEDPILRVAMEFNNSKFIDSVIKCSEDLPGKLKELLDAKGLYKMNCLHYAFKVQLPKALGTTSRGKQETASTPERPRLVTTINMIQKFLRAAKPETIASQDEYGNTPIHYALDYNLCRLGKAHRSIVEYIVKKGDQPLKKNAAHQFNLKNESPYLYFLRTQQEWKKKQNITRPSAATTMDKGIKLSTKEIENISGPKGIILTGPTKDRQDELMRIEHQRRVLPPKPGPMENSTLYMPPPPLPAEKGKYSTPGGGKDQVRDVDYDQEHFRRPSLHHSEPPVAQETPQKLASPGDITFPKSLTRTLTQNFDQMDTSTQRKAPPSIADSSIKPSVSRQQEKNFEEAERAANEIGEFVKIHYIRTRTDMEAKELLYGIVASDKNLYFDASHLAGRTVEQVVELIDRLWKAGGFENTLSYVNLPILSTIHEKSSASKADKLDGRGYNSNEKRQRRGASQENPTLGRSALISVFDKLVSVNVRKILRLHVDDRGTLPHTDAAIERAIRGRDSFSLGHTRNESIEVEHWDWRKPDLSLDVIAFAAPNVTNVNLYWSGNQAVLRGWCSPIASSNLEKVTLHAYAGFESRERMMKMIERFENEIKGQTNEKKLKIEKRIHSGSVTSNYKSDDDLEMSEVGVSDGPPQQVWVEKMEGFRSALISIHEVLKNKIPEPQRIKVALIDDGIDLSNLDTYNIVQATGLSYCPPNGKTERPWHQSTNGHGTVMANMIVRINPWVSLDVMKIQDSITYIPGGKTRTIYAESAARAIKGAIIRKADIISMSWTIRKLAKKSSGAPNTVQAIGTGAEYKKSSEEVAMEALQKAIEQARSEKILMFCSAADDIQLLGRESLPFSAAQDCIFRIGAAMPKGQRDPTSEDVKSISYFFPGNQVAEARNPRSSKPVEYHDGSSVSTALAAGLASLIMYCTNVVKTYYEAVKENDLKTRETITDWGLKLRSHKNMRTAFDNINYQDYEDRKFLPVWKIFGEATERINNAEGEKKIDELETLVRDLCHKLEAE